MDFKLSAFSKRPQSLVYFSLHVVEESVLAHMLNSGQPSGVFRQADLFIFTVLCHLNDSFQRHPKVGLLRIEKSRQEFCQFTVPRIDTGMGRVIRQIHAGGKGALANGIPVIAKLSPNAVIYIDAAAGNVATAQLINLLRRDSHHTGLIQPVKESLSGFLRDASLSNETVSELVDDCSDFSTVSDRN